jgi:chromate transporter
MSPLIVRRSSRDSAQSTAGNLDLLELALYFLRLGTFGFGGPIALVGYMQKDLVEERGWFSKEDYLQGLAFCQLSPGRWRPSLRSISAGFERVYGVEL